MNSIAYLLGKSFFIYPLKRICIHLPDVSKTHQLPLKYFVRAIWGSCFTNMTFGPLLKRYFSWETLFWPYLGRIVNPSHLVMKNGFWLRPFVLQLLWKLLLVMVNKLKVAQIWGGWVYSTSVRPHTEFFMCHTWRKMWIQRTTIRMVRIVKMNSSGEGIECFSLEKDDKGRIWLHCSSIPRGIT